MSAPSRSSIFALLAFFAPLACGGSVVDSANEPDGDVVEDAQPGVDSSLGPSDVAPPTDAIGPVVDAKQTDATRPADTSPPPPPPTDAAAPRRLPCSPRGALATDLPKNVDGALEGELVSILPPGSGGACPNDADHLHLQILVGTSRYDVAITVNDTTSASPMAILTKDIGASTAPAGWSSARFDYPTNLGAHSTDFTPLAKTELVARWLTELKDASHVSVHGLSYTDGTGLHDVHRNGGGHDGVVLVHLGGVDHAIAERFATSVF